VLPVSWRAKAQSVVDRLRSSGSTIERNYQIWLELHERTDEQARRLAVDQVALLTDPPLISVLMPVYNPSPRDLQAAIESVRGQFYTNWELCIADDCSTDPQVGSVLRDMQTQDPRIKIVWRLQNGHISAASNSALDIASGSFVALLDHDDLLSPRALYEVVMKVASQPTLDVIYSDEDHIDAAGRRSRPYFKPGWNPELLLGQNLISHLGVYRRALLQRIGGFRFGLEGSQDWDLALRAVAETTPDRIVHLPFVLYHWRQGSDTRTFSESALERCARNGRIAVSEFLARSGVAVQMAPAPRLPMWARVIYPIPSPEPFVSVIILPQGDIGKLDRCLAGLLTRTDYAGLEVLLVDKGGAERNPFENTGRLTQDPRVRSLRYARSLNYAQATNLAARGTAGSLILLLSDDIDVAGPGWLREMISHANRTSVGAVGAELLFRDGTIQHSGITLGMGGVAGDPYLRRSHRDPGYFGHLQLARNVSAVNGACLMVRRQTFMDVGGLNETPSAAAFRDVDFCLKLMERGLRNVWTPHAELYNRGATPKAFDRTAPDALCSDQAASYLRQRWGHWIDNDPYWNPNLSLNAADIALAFPPRHFCLQRPQAA